MFRKVLASNVVHLYYHCRYSVGSDTDAVCTVLKLRHSDYICFNLVSLQTMLPTILHYFPAGSSTKAWRHYVQLLNSGTKHMLTIRPKTGHEGPEGK
jgi:hypothetical protein